MKLRDIVLIKEKNISFLYDIGIFGEFWFCYKGAKSNLGNLFGALSGEM